MSHDSINVSITKHQASLAKLSLSDEDLESLSSQLDETLKYIENLAELDTSSVDTSSHSTNEHNIFFTDGEASMNALSHEEALLNAPKVLHDCFVVDRIL